MKTKPLLYAALLASFTLVGCNTVDGLGKDLEEAGDEIQDASN